MCGCAISLRSSCRMGSHRSLFHAIPQISTQPLFFLTYYLCISSSLSFFPSGKPLNKTFPRLSFASTVLLKSSSSIALTASRSPYGLTSAFGLCPLTLIHRKRKQKTEAHAMPGSLAQDPQD